MQKFCAHYQSFIELYPIQWLCKSRFPCSAILKSDVGRKRKAMRSEYCFLIWKSLKYGIKGKHKLAGMRVGRSLAVYYHHVIMSAMTSQITSLTIVYSSVYSDADQRKHQSSASLAFVRGIHRWPVNSPHKGPVTWKMFPFDDVIIYQASESPAWCH